MKIYVGNLRFETKPEELRELFAGHRVVSAAIVKDLGTGRQSSIGVVDIPDQQEAEAAIAAVSNKPIVKARGLIVKRGMSVVYGKYAGTEVELKGTKHLILQESELIGVVDDAGFHAGPAQVGEVLVAPEANANPLNEPPSSADINPVMPSPDFKEDIAYFRALLPQLLAEHPGQFALVHGGSLIGVFPTRAEGLTRAYEKLGQRTAFVLQQIAPAETRVDRSSGGMLPPCRG